jgi:hypothetical protein
MSTVSAAHVVNLDALPLFKPTKVTTQRFWDHRPLDGRTDAQYDALKKAVLKPQAAGKLGAEPSRGEQLVKTKPSVSGSAGPLVVGPTTYFTAQSENGWDPPDMALAVGTNFVVQMVNNSIAVYDKHGNMQAGYPKSSDTFFDLNSGTFTSDPRLVYDWTYHRYIVVMLYESSPTSGTNTGGLLIAVSQGQDPRGNWYVYNGPAITVGSAGDCPDYPTLGHDSNNWGPGATKGGFYIGINLFSGSGNCSGSSFSGNFVFMFPKDAFYSGSGFSGWQFDGLNVGGTLVDTLEAANMTEWSDKPSTILLINSFNFNFNSGCSSANCNGLEVWSISGPSGSPNNPFDFLQSGGSGPTLTGVEVATAHNYSFPPKASEPGCTVAEGPCLDTNDVRISGQVKYHAGELFGSFNTGVSGTSVTGPIWFEVHPIVSTSSVITGAEERQEDCFLCGGWANNGSAWFATLQPDGENNLIMVFDHSTDADYPQTAYTSRRSTFGDSLMNGAGFDIASGSSQVTGRWGDYTATAIDLTIANAPYMWFAGQYADASNGWGTVIGAAQYAVPSDQ